MKTIFLSLFLSTVSLLSFGQTTFQVTVSGNVTESDSGAPVMGQPVNIMAGDSLMGWTFYNTVVTDSLGQYEDQFDVPSFITQSSVTATTLGCDGDVSGTESFNPSNTNLTINLEICIDSASSDECQADFWYYYDENDMMTVHFTDASSGNPTAWQWDFGDGETSAEQNPVHTYTQEDMYNVALTITTDSCTSTREIPVWIGDSTNYEYCTAMFVAFPEDGDSASPFTMHFLDMSVGANGMPPATWSWDFGDGSNSTEQNPVHIYDNEGTYNVCLTIADTANDCEDTFCAEVIVTNWNENDCDAFFEYYYTDSIPQAGDSLSVQFVDASEGNPNSWQWDFGDGSSSQEQNPIHLYSQSGEYQVCLSISNTADSCSDTYCQEVYVYNDSTQDCNSWFTWEADSTASLNINFNAFNSNDTPANFSWDFGDDETGSGSPVTHTYAQDGLYEVWLTTQDSTGCSSTYVDWVFVGNEFTFSFDGNVYLEDSLTTDVATVYLMTFDTTEDNLIAITQTQTNDAGYYQFTGIGLEHCIYFVQAELDSSSAYFGNYVPTYHLNAINWEEALPIFPFPAGYSYNIFMQPSQSASTGHGNISGMVYGNNTRGIMSNVEIMLLNEQEQPLYYTRTNSGGIFSFDSLAMGTYVVYPEIVGIKTIPGTVILSENNPSANVNVIVADGKAVLGIAKISAFIEGVSNIFPNPVSTDSYLEIGMKNHSVVKISVVNQLGRTINTQSYTLNSGLHKIHLDMSSLANGVYFVKIIPQDQVQIVRKFVKTK